MVRAPVEFGAGLARDQFREMSVESYGGAPCPHNSKESEIFYRASLLKAQDMASAVFILQFCINE